jgi:O-antigen/teichoic acid export membrane protein
MIGLAKVSDSILGTNNAILYSSRYYKTVLLFGICLAVLTILLNLWFIPGFGINGAALASFIAILIFNMLKVWFVYHKFQLLPFTKGTLKVFVVLSLLFLVFAYVNFPFHPIANIALRSLLMIVVYVIILYRFKISEDVSGIISRFLNR